MFECFMRNKDISAEFAKVGLRNIWTVAVAPPFDRSAPNSEGFSGVQCYIKRSNLVRIG